MKQIKKVLIANRGEIACRIMRTLKDRGLMSVAVYSEADASAWHVKMADMAYPIGASPAAESYLDGARIIKAAIATGADAIHPAYGFLSENAGFAKAVNDAGLIFIGPPARAIAQMGDKAAAKDLMLKAGVPCVPGYQGAAQDDDTLMGEADHIGFPVMIKAAYGGGGRGMRFVAHKQDMAAALTLARSEAENAFGDGQLIIEKAIAHPRHVEIQIFADTQGRVVHLGERDCSVQRRHQKVIEEAPCPIMTRKMRDDMGAAAIKAAQAIDYVGAGTVEFLLDENGDFYFLEMNTRLQVEHPVTEKVTGLDLVALQIDVAQGLPLPFEQMNMNMDGHAMEVRLYAEDPSQDFLPSTGAVHYFVPFQHEGVRYDCGIESGQMVSPFYDPMLAKIITHGQSRDEARRLMIKALQNMVLFGVANNRDFLLSCLEADDFAAHQVTTDFINRAFPNGWRPPVPTPYQLAALALCQFQLDHHQAAHLAVHPVSDLMNFTGTYPLGTPYKLSLHDIIYDIHIAPFSQRLYRIKIGDEVIEFALATSQPITGADGLYRFVLTSQSEEEAVALTCYAALCEGVLYASIEGRNFMCQDLLRAPAHNEEQNDGQHIFAPMHGRIVDLLVGAGTRVTQGARLMIIEAMKMQHEITAPMDGVVEEVLVAPEQQIAAGDLLLSFAQNEDDAL